MTVEIHLPVSHAAIRVEDTLRQFRLEGMLPYLRLIDLHSQPRTAPRPAQPPSLLHLITFRNTILPPRYVQVDGLTDDIGRSGVAELKRCGGADGSLWIVGGHGDAV